MEAVQRQHQEPRHNLPMKRSSKWLLAAAVPLTAWAGVSVMQRYFGLHIELGGSGLRPMFSFYKPETHIRQLERQRQEQKMAVPVVEAAVSGSPAVAPDPDNWTTFRGPRLLGRYDERPILTNWPKTGLKQLWRQPVGGGYASFVIARGKAITIEQRRRQEVVAAYDVSNGRELWSHGWDASFEESLGGPGPRATPTYDDGRIYALGAEGELRCLDAATGKRIWSHNILTQNGAENLTWGMSAAPLVVDGKVIVLPGGPGGRSIVAYDKLTGAVVWKSLDDKQSYTSPAVVTLAGKRQLIVVSGIRAMGVAIEDGALLWDYPWRTEHDINSAQPLVTAPNRFFISAGYGHGAALVEIHKSDGKFAARTVWSNNRMKNKFSSSVLHAGYLYGLDEAILACMEAATGELKWKGGRYGYGQLLLAGDHLVVLGEAGEVALVKAAPDAHNEIARFQAIEGKTWNNPAIAAGRLFVRNTTEMAAFRIGPE